MKLRDRFWLWGHPEGRYNNNEENFGLMEDSRMTPMECCLYLGVPNTFMVPVGWQVNRRQYNKSFKTLKNVGWEFFRKINTPELIEDYIAEAREFPNISCVVFDDFKFNMKKHSYDELKKNLTEVISRLHNNELKRLDAWMVLYTHEFGVDGELDREFQPIMDLFDGIIMWNWEESHYKEIPEKFECFKTLTSKNRRMLGCYLYNFGESRQATGEAVRYQLDRYREWILAGEAEGVVLHTNTMADLDYEAYDACLDWMALHGDEEVADI